MVKVVDKGERFCSITLDGSESSITFQEEYLYFSVQNNSDSVVYISLNRDIVPNADGVMAVNAGSSVLFGHMKNANHFFAKGTGPIQIAAANEPINFFVNASTSGGGESGGDYYTKAQSDAKYVQASNLADVAMSGSYSDLKGTPEKLPADGGNAATVGGVGIANLRQITQTVINTLPVVPNGEGDYLVNCDTSDTTFPYWYGYMSVRYGSYTGEYVAIFRTTGNDNKVYYNTYLTNHWSGWQEISATPIKSTIVSGTTDANSNLAVFPAAGNKILIIGFYYNCICIPIVRSDGLLCMHMTAIDGTNMAKTTIPSMEVFYFER